MIGKFDTFFSVTRWSDANDTFEFNVNNFNGIINYHVFLSVWNGHKFSAGKDNNETAYGYLIDVALFDSIPFVPASPPLFKEEL